MSTSLYRQVGLPLLQNRVYDTKTEASFAPTADIDLQQDPDTGIVTNVLFDPAKVTYDDRYDNDQSGSSLFFGHLLKVSEIVRKRLGCQGLVEIGCGKAKFLELLLSQGVDVRGCDPSYDGSNSRVVRRAFSADAVGAASGIILRHVLEHIADPFSFLEKIAKSNGGRGAIYIEVPCFDWILQAGAWWDVCYEHVNYFRLNDLVKMFGRVVEAGRIFGGQYLYIVADLASLRRPSAADSLNIRLQGAARSVAMMPHEFGIWGCATKGVILSLLAWRGGKVISACIDVNPAKQGKFLPVTGLRVEAPEDGLSRLSPTSVLVVVNGMYFEEIRERVRGRVSLVCLEDWVR